MNALIITIQDKYNYGNRLQNVAAQEILQKLNLQVASLSVCPLKSKIQWKIKDKILFFLSKNFSLKIRQAKLRHKRVARFEPFNRKNLRMRKIRDVSRIPSADFYVVGSDQVWNMGLFFSDMDLYFLSFANSEQKACLSPSFGADYVPEGLREDVKQALNTFPLISVREAAGAKIVKDLTGKEAEVLIDPTLALDASDWRKFSKKPKNVDTDRPYIFTYILGEKPRKLQEAVDRIVKETGASLYPLNDYDAPELFIADPGEFLYLIEHATIVLTDSFHACVFSFLFGKPFLLFAREGKENYMLSRMETLFETFDLKRKFVEDELPSDLYECDYSVGYGRLSAEREKLFRFLKKSMNLAV